MKGPHDEGARRSLRLEVCPADDPVAPEEGKDVVAVPALGRGLVHLDEVIEVEHASRERTVPEEVVEGGEEHRRGGGGAIQLDTGGHEHRRAVVLDRMPLEHAVRDE